MVAETPGPMKCTSLMVALLASACGGGRADAPADAPADGPPDAAVDPEPTTVVSLTFDDTRADQYQVGAMVAARQMRATFYVNSSRLGREGYMTREQLGALQAQGNEIGGHSLAHVYLSTLDSDAARREVCDDRVALLAAGLEASTFAYPFGDESTGLRRIAALCGYTAARDSGGLVTGSHCADCPLAEQMPPVDAFDINSISSIASTATLEDLEQYVLQAEAAGGGWVPLVFHRVCDGCSDSSVTAATLSAFLDWLAARRSGGTAVQTVAQVMGGAVQPGTAGPLPGPGANLVPNPSLELDGNRDEVPDCWHRRGSGTNDATYALVDGAFDGAIAQQISITSYTDGTRRLLTRPECPVPTRPGRAYRITSWYVADTPPRFAVYYRNAAGIWLSLAQSPPFPTSPTYVEATYTTPPLPADATAISVGMSIAAVGTLTMDAFSATDPSVTVGDPPVVAMAGLVDGATVSDVVTLAARASGAGGIDHVDFRVNDRLEDWDDAEPFAIPWDTTRLHRGAYVITARAFDRAGNVTTSPAITVTVP